jgi:hypothetical protein
MKERAGIRRNVGEAAAKTMFRTPYSRRPFAGVQKADDGVKGGASGTDANR